MTIYEKIKELIEKDDKKALGIFLCRIHDCYSFVNEECDEIPCDTCPAREYCWDNHTGWIYLLDDIAEER